MKKRNISVILRDDRRRSGHINANRSPRQAQLLSLLSRSISPSSRVASEYKVRRIKHKGRKMQRKKYLTLKEDLKLLILQFLLNQSKIFQTEINKR